MSQRQKHNTLGTTEYASQENHFVDITFTLFHSMNVNNFKLFPCSEFFPDFLNFYVLTKSFFQIFFRKTLSQIQKSWIISANKKSQVWHDKKYALMSTGTTVLWKLRFKKLITLNPKSMQNLLCIYLFKRQKLTLQ